MECTGLRRLVVVTGMLALGATTLVGCGGEEIKGGTLGDDTPVPESSTTSGATTKTPRPTSTANSEDRLATELEAVAGEFYAALNEAFLAGDPSLFSKYVGANCDTCRDYAKYIKSIRDKGQRDVGADSYKLTNFALTDDKNDVSATYTLTTPAGKRVDANGEIVETFEAETYREQMFFVRGDDGWLIDRILALD